MGYNNPLTQTIITNKYTKSHIDLLVEEASPASPSFSPIGADRGIDLKQAFSSNEIENGGQTPGPFEDMRRKLAALSGSATSSPATTPGSSNGGIRKRKRKEKKRQWVWTIGVADEEEEDDERVGGAIVASRAEAAASARATAKMPSSNGHDDEAVPRTAVEVPDIQMVPDTPTASIESNADSAIDIDMSDASSVISEDFHAFSGASLGYDLDMKTPTEPRAGNKRKRERDTPIPELAEAQDASVSVS